MINRITKECTECPYCHENFEEKYECNEHIKDNHIDWAVYIKKVFFQCSVCCKDYKLKEDAMKCDESHENGTDTAWQDELQQQEFIKLQIAANKAGQKRLF